MSNYKEKQNTVLTIHHHIPKKQHIKNYLLNMKILKFLTQGLKLVEICHRFVETYNLHKHRAEVIRKEDITGNIVHCHIQLIIIVKNMIDTIINLNHLLIITNLNTILII